MGVCKYGSDVSFVYKGNVLSGLSGCYVGKCSENFGVGFGFVVDVVSMCLKLHSSIVCHTECGGRVGVGYGCVELWVVYSIRGTKV